MNQAKESGWSKGKQGSLNEFNPGKGHNHSCISERLHYLKFEPMGGGLETRWQVTVRVKVIV